MRLIVNDQVIENSDPAVLFRTALETFTTINLDGTVTPPGIDLVRSWAIATINTQAGDQRIRYATNIPFQGDLYQLKGKEALAYQSDPNGNYPILQAEAAARGVDPTDLAAEYLVNAALFPQILAAIEAVRMATITALKSAASIAQIETALATVTWPTF